MKNKIRKYWVETLDLMVKNPVVLMPFVFIAFLEILTLEFLYFSYKEPLSYLANPVVRKFFGETAIHYPGNVMILAKLFYWAQVAIYISIGVTLSATAVNIFKNVREKLPVRLGAMLKNSFRRYFGYFAYGCLIIAASFLLNKLSIVIFAKGARLVGKLLPQLTQAYFYTGFTIFQFVVSVIMYTLLISIIPLMVIEKKSFLKSFMVSLYLGVRHFFSIFTLILLPFIIYLPFIVLKSFPSQLADKLFPEVNLLVLAVGVGVTIFVDCFMILCVSQRLIDTRKPKASK